MFFISRSKISIISTLDTAFYVRLFIFDPTIRFESVNTEETLAEKGVTHDDSI
jgi:hypothetical protein